MPCYLFTFHGYGTWLADDRRGYTKRSASIRPRDEAMGQRYRANLKHEPTWFNARLQHLLIDEAITACRFQRLRLHHAATEPTHLHTLVSWDDYRAWDDVRPKLKESLSRRLNKIQRRPWLTDNASRKQVKDQAHFDYLNREYLPNHNGWKWSQKQGYYLDRP